MPILTDDMEKEYLRDSSVCPFCGSESISGGHFEVDGCGASQYIDCANCGESWQDVYRPTGVYHKETEEHRTHERRSKMQKESHDVAGMAG